MDNNLIIILLVVLIVVVIIFIAVLCYFGHRFLKMKEQQLQSGDLSTQKSPEFSKDFGPKKKEVSQEVLESLRAKSKEDIPSIYCVDHPDEYAVGKCAICGDSFCEHCLSKQGEVKIAKKYLDLYLDFEWQEIYMLVNNDHNQNLRKKIIEKKQQLWEEQGIPLIVQGHYKINVQNDEIEEYTVVFSRVDDKKVVENQLQLN